MNGQLLKTRNSKASLLIALLVLLFSSSIYPQDPYQKAQQLAKDGDISGMGDAYLKILSEHPDDIRGQLGLATARSWLGDHEMAQKYYRQVLNQQPDNLEALIGLGYDYAWSRQFVEADAQFSRALEIAPTNIGAQKGQAFSYLWNDQPQKTLDILQSLEVQLPDDAEILAAKGQAYMALSQNEAAIDAFERALQISPGRADAVSGIASIKQQKKTFDIVAWLGDTSDGGDTGIREIILGYSLKNDLRVWARYDNSLSLDNPALVRSGADAETYYFGAQNKLTKNWLGNLEVGSRNLPNKAGQKIYKVEAINIKQNRHVFKLGGQLSPHSDNYTDKLIYSAYGFPVNNRWRLEPSVYLSSSGAIDDREIRAVVFGEYQDPGRWSFGVGAGVGRISSDNAAAEGSVVSKNILFSYPISQKNKLNLSARHENSPSNSYTTMLVGIAIQLP